MKRLDCAVICSSLVFLALLSLSHAGEGGAPQQSRRQIEPRRAKGGTEPEPPVAVGHPTFVSPHASPVAVSGGKVFVANTPSDTVDVIDAATRKIVRRVSVGIDPVSIAVRPDGREVWVSNHVSDSVSVIDNQPDSPTYLHVVATVQQFDLAAKATTFDEPAGIAFASNKKAYVALSSENQIAVVDVATRKVTRRLSINAQDPRAIAVRGGRLYVIPFESNNKTQLSGGRKEDIDGKLVTFDAWEHSIRHNNVLSLGHVTDIVKHPAVPDRDLFIFDTETDKLIETVDTLGTLLYGLTVDSQGRVFIAQTDARNHINGRAGTKKHDLSQLQNRAFLNQITRVEFSDGKAAKPQFFELEPLPPEHPQPGQALATPFAIQVSDDDKTLVASAAGSGKLFTVDAKSGAVLGRVAVGAVPRGVALENGAGGKLSRAWVYNAVANTVSVVDVSDAANPQIADFIRLEDPTEPQIKLGRTWFNDASASTTGTFSCASCHPDGHTDQLLWVLKTPVVSGGNQIMPRSTMPVRGLRDTAPFHWDGVPGDPYGGVNSASIYRPVEPNSSVDQPESTTRNVIDGGLATTMHFLSDKGINDEGKSGKLSAAERDDMAKFLLNIPYPPAQRRAFDNKVSTRAKEGFKLFHIEGDNDPTKSKPNVCGNCHRMPHLVSTNTPGTGMDAPTWRGAYDRFLILPQGRLNIIDFDFYARVAEQGQPERSIWQFSWAGRRRFDPVWNMVLEGSTGYSGSFARQVTLNQATADSFDADERTGAKPLSMQLLHALEVSAAEGAIVLQCDGVLTGGASAEPLTLQFNADDNRGMYVQTGGERRAFTREKLVSLAASGKFTGTFTGRHGAQAQYTNPQPALWTRGPIEKQRGRQQFPILYGAKKRMTISGRHIRRGASIVVDGRRAPGTVSTGDKESVAIEFDKLPAPGMHLLQIQNPGGLFSNDFIFHVAAGAEAAAELQQSIDEPHIGSNAALVRAVAGGRLNEVKRRLGDAKRINSRHGDEGATLLSTAALHGRLEVARYLIERGANVNATNRDGNTPLHVAAFLCRTDVVQLLLDKGGDVNKRSNRRETPVDVVSGKWSGELAAFYNGIAGATRIKLDLKHIESERPRIAQLLQKHAKQQNNRPN